MDNSSQDEKRNRVVGQAFQCRRALEVYAFSMLKDRAEAEDLVQDAFIVVMEKFEDFTEGTSMMAWTRAIVRLKVLQLLEKRSRRAKILDSVREKTASKGVFPGIQRFKEFYFGDCVEVGHSGRQCF